MALRNGKNAAVVGCGIVGLATASLLQEQGLAVTIIAAAIPPHTTSDIAAAIWYPFEASPPGKVNRWSKQSYAHYQRVAAAGTPGVSMVEAIQYFAAKPPKPYWLQPEYPFSELPQERCPPGYGAGYTVTVPLIETPAYMAHLVDRFLTRGGQLEQAKVNRLEDLYSQWRLVFNCTGLGAGALTGDRQLFPIRGQIAVAEPLQKKQWLIDDTRRELPIYVISRENDCILGGTADSGASHLEEDPQTTAAIVAACRQICPQITAKAIRQVRVGLRPGRDQVRLEREDHGATRLIHNYGHGGAGFTLAWGCAAEALVLASISQPHSG